MLVIGFFVSLSLSLVHPWSEHYTADYLYKETSYGLPVTNRVYKTPGPANMHCDYIPCAPNDIAHDRAVKKTIKPVYDLSFIKPVGFVADTLVFAALTYAGIVIWRKKR